MDKLCLLVQQRQDELVARLFRDGHEEAEIRAGLRYAQPMQAVLFGNMNVPELATHAARMQFARFVVMHAISYARGERDRTNDAIEGLSVELIERAFQTVDLIFEKFKSVTVSFGFESDPPARTVPRGKEFARRVRLVALKFMLESLDTSELIERDFGVKAAHNGYVAEQRQ